jgi:hypothetical protein
MRIEGGNQGIETHIHELHRNLSQLRHFGLREPFGLNHFIKCRFKVLGLF